MKRILLFAAVFFCFNLFSQNQIDQVFVLNEGYFDYSLNQTVEPVCIGVYDPATANYTTIDTIFGARFASDLIVDDGYFYVAADNMLYKYDKVTYDMIDSHQVDGIRNIAIWNDKLIVSRGDYDNVTFQPILFNTYLQMFNKSDLTFYAELDTISGPKWATQNIVIDNDKAYVAINNAYEWGNEKGLIGIVDLNTMSYTELDLGPDGKNPDNMMKNGDKIYTINNKDWSGMSISEVDINLGTVNTVNQSSISTGCGTSCMRDGRINYQVSADTILYEWDVLLQNNSNPIYGFNKNFYALSVDTINNQLYASSTDYFSYGFIDIYDENNILLHTFQCGISPGKIVFDLSSNTTSIGNNINLEYQNNNLYYDLSGKIVSLPLKNRFYIQNNKVIFISK